MEYADLLLHIRTKCSLSQEELAKELGVSFAYTHEFQRFLQAFENGITLLIHRHNSG